MAGHSKWAQIKHKKASVDARRGKLFAKISRAIAIATRDLGSDPSVNLQLRIAIEKAREANMPQENIERAVQRGSGSGEEKLLSFVYEAYGPGGVAVLITGVTDNNNRSSNEIKHLLTENNAKWADPGSVAWAFEKSESGWASKGYSVVSLNSEDSAKLEKLKDLLLDHEDVLDVYTNQSL